MFPRSQDLRPTADMTPDVPPEPTSHARRVSGPPTARAVDAPRQVVRRIARRAALDALSARDRLQDRTARAFGRPRVHFLYLHAVPPHEERRFRELLSELSRAHTFVSYSRAVEILRGGEIDGPYICFSFDDGFASNVRTASLLAEYDASACFFIPPDFIGCPDAAAARRFFRSSDVDERAMRWDEVEGLLQTGHEIGNHSRHHFNIGQLPAARLEDEIAGAADELERRLGRRPEHFAWPLGRFHQFTDRAASVVFDCGHRTCASAERGAHVQAPAFERYCLRRDHLMTSWPLRHMLHFIAASAAGASVADNDWPAHWRVVEHP